MKSGDVSGFRLLALTYHCLDTRLARFDRTGHFFMGGSLVVPKYRRQGLYHELIRKVFEVTADEGFQSVSSLHVLTNNAVIIAKLQMDFHIYGVEVNTRFGALVRLIYHHSELKRKALRFRAGAVQETEIYELLSKK